MIIKKKLNQIPFLNILIKILNRLIQFLGTISLLVIIFLLFHYFNSGMYERFKPIALIKKIDKVIFDKYLGFSFFEIDDYTSQKIKSLKFILFENELDNIIIKIDQKNLYNLELQRINKSKGLTEKVEKFSRAKLNFKDDDYNIKLRVKGDRVLHWYDKKQTSYRIDLRGDDRIWGLEEFSVQKPITRNYIYEYIFHKILEANNLISLKYFFINLSLNDTNQGIYAVEEGFSKELIERNKKRNGPIFGVEDSVSLNYPIIEYDLYSKKYWLSNHPELVNEAYSKLDNLKNNFNVDNEIFDLEKWATYFAIIDLTGSFHGSIPKSVKLFYNPVTAKFEPIGFDGHFNDSLFDDFLLLDFLDTDNHNCSYICKEREWFLKFLKNDEFRNIYFKKLAKISSKKSIREFYAKNIESINFYNNQFLSETSKKDKTLYKGVGLYLFNQNYLFDRSNYIQNRIKEIEKKLVKKKIIETKKFKKNNLLIKKEIKSLENNYILQSDLTIDKTFFLSKNNNLIIQPGVKIFFEKDVSIISEGSIIFNGTRDKPITIYSSKGFGSLIFSNNDYKFSNVIFKNLSYPKDKNKILYAGVNIINSNVEIVDSQIISSNSEDGINLISSRSNIQNLKVQDIQSDAIDIDFGTLNFSNIICKDISNDCLDISGAKVAGNYIEGYNIQDKGLSFGENAVGEISNLNFQNSKLGIAVKDGSNLKLSNYIFKDNEFDVAVFNKKKEYEGSSLIIDDSNADTKFSYLIGLKNQITINRKPLEKKIDNKIINNLFY